MILSLAGAGLGFANPLLHLPPAVFLLPGALLFIARTCASWKTALLTGAIATIPAYTVGLYWLAIPVHDYGHLPWILALPCPVLLGTLLALYAGIFCAGMRFILPCHPIVFCLSAGVFWTSLELLRNVLFSGFPWLPLASALAPYPAVLGLCSWIGAFGLSGIIVTIPACLLAMQGPWKLTTIAFVGLLFLPHSGPVPQADTPTCTVALIQGNIPQDQKWDAQHLEATLTRYLELTQKSLNKHPDLAIWPETAVPFYFQEGGLLVANMRQRLQAMGIPLIFGAPAYSPQHQPGNPPFLLHNRAYLLDSQGEISSFYDKEHLVPFGEYAPLGDWLPFLRKLVPGVYEFQPGINQKLLSIGTLRAGMLICYEVIFPELAQKQVQQGANLLINISNDGWFGNSSAPIQHLHLAVLRAAEQQRAIVRGTNTGISAVIAPNGQILQQSPLFLSCALTGKKIPLLTGQSFYHEHYDLITKIFILLCALILIGHRAHTRF